MLGSLSLATLTRTGAASAFPGGDQAVIPMAEFYTQQTRERWGAWGPPARQFPAPAGSSTNLPGCSGASSPRRGATSASAISIIMFRPSTPDEWPWISVSAGRNGPGLDCSNFTSLVFNTTPGIKLPTAIADQAENRRGGRSGQ